MMTQEAFHLDPEALMTQTDIQLRSTTVATEQFDQDLQNDHHLCLLKSCYGIIFMAFSCSLKLYVCNYIITSILFHRNAIC